MTSMVEGHNEAAPRFEFGKNWLSYAEGIEQSSIEVAAQSLCDLFGVESLAGLRFLDIGSGSGLFSLAARSLGASVVSFDFDLDSVRCTEALRERFAPGDHHWRVLQGSVLDPQFLSSLGTFDVVYSWGVLHHTGDLQRALENAKRTVAANGLLSIAIYNDQGIVSRYWKLVKRLYNAGRVTQVLVVLAHLPYLAARIIVRSLRRRGAEKRAMSLWHDYIDWLGGYPFEVATPEQIFNAFKDQFQLMYLTTCGGKQGCNEFVFQKKS